MTGIKRGQPLWIRELSTAGSSACQQTMSTPEEQTTVAVQQLNVQLQQFLETLETILRTVRIELEEQVQNATSITTHKDPMIRADRLFKLRSYLGAVDQRNELELTITEESSTPRLIGELSMLMYYMLVMMKTLYRCRYAGLNEGFAGRMQFVKEWDPWFVGLTRNVLSCERKDDVPTQITETVIDDIMTDVNVLRMEDERVEACFIRAVYRCERRTSRSREHNSTLTVILCQCRSVCSRRARAKASMARMQGRNRLRK